MMNIKQHRSFGTHDGSFHADEVTACALLLVHNLIDEDKIFRTRDPNILNTCEYVCDVGGIYNPKDKLFDHHQADYKGNLSSAGMILKYLQENEFLKLEDAEMLKQTVVLGVDAHDNGQELHAPGVFTYSHIISNFMPIAYEVEDNELHLAFKEALFFAVNQLKRLIQRFSYIKSFKEQVEKKMKEGKDSLIFEKAIPWMDPFFSAGGENHSALFVVMPSKGHWKLRAIPPNSHEKMKVRKPLPQAWAGLSSDDLKKASGVSGAIFCHKGRFFSLWETEEDALRALKIALKKD